MRSGVLMWSVCLLVTVLLFYSGCAPESDVDVSVKPEQDSTYRTVTESDKFYKFEQPSEKKVTEKKTVSVTEMVYDQTITNVDERGNTTADITIKELLYATSTPEGSREDFNSSRASDSDKPLAKLLGQSYTIKISPSGEVTEVLNAQAARSAVQDEEAGRVAKYLLSNDAIKKRHSIYYLPPSGRKKMSRGDVWKSVEASPRGMLIPKSYEKIYRVKNISSSDSGRIATITMKALPTSKKAEGVPEQAIAGLGFFAGMFDTEETFEGELVINLDSGQIIKFNESLISESTAAQMPSKAASDAEPDVLSLRFTQRNSTEVIN